MKDFIRRSLISSFALFLISSFYPGLTVPGSLTGLLWAGILISLINQLVKPVIKLLLLPFNLLTFGLLAWLANVLVIYLAVRIVPGLTVSGFTLPGLDYAGFIIPEIHLNLFLSLIITAFLYNLIYNFLDYALVADTH